MPPDNSTNWPGSRHLGWRHGLGGARRASSISGCVIFAGQVDDSPVGGIRAASSLIDAASTESASRSGSSRHVRRFRLLSFACRWRARDVLVGFDVLGLGEGRAAHLRARVSSSLRVGWMTRLSWASGRRRVSTLPRRNRRLTRRAGAVLGAFGFFKSSDDVRSSCLTGFFST